MTSASLVDKGMLPCFGRRTTPGTLTKTSCFAGSDTFPVKKRVNIPLANHLASPNTSESRPDVFTRPCSQPWKLGSPSITRSPGHIVWLKLQATPHVSAGHPRENAENDRREATRIGQLRPLVLRLHRTLCQVRSWHSSCAGKQDSSPTAWPDPRLFW